MRFLILGAGGVGGFFGGKLAMAGNDVWFLARGAHLEAMRSTGLRIVSTSGEWRVPPGKMSDRITDVGTPDVVLFCVKSYDTNDAARQLAPALKPSSIVICLQNGIDNEESIKRIISCGTVYGGAAYVSARMTAPGEITETGGFWRIVIGPLEGTADDRADTIQRTFLEAGIRCDVRSDIMKELWKKLMFIASMGSFTALSYLTQGEILAQPQTLALVFDAMREVWHVAQGLGIDLEPLDEAKMTESMKGFDPGTRSSLYYDLINGKPLEIEALNGTIVRLGQELGIPTPIHRVIYSALLPHHLKHSGKLTSNSPA